MINLKKDLKNKKQVKPGFEAKEYYLNVYVVCRSSSSINLHKSRLVHQLIFASRDRMNSLSFDLTSMGEGISQVANSDMKNKFCISDFIWVFVFSSRNTIGS